MHSRTSTSSHSARDIPLFSAINNGVAQQILRNVSSQPERFREKLLHAYLENSAEVGDRVAVCYSRFGYQHPAFAEQLGSLYDEALRRETSYSDVLVRLTGVSQQIELVLNGRILYRMQRQ